MSALEEADIQRIQSILPHRYPFLMVDRVEQIDSIKSACGIKNVSMNEPHFQGHFPDTPIMPGVLIVEALAQTATVMFGVTSNLKRGEMLVYFMSIDKCKFRRKVIPGDVLKLYVETIRAGSKISKFKGRAMVGDELAAEVEFTAMMDLQE